MVKESSKRAILIVGIALAIVFGLLLVAVSFQGVSSLISSEPASSPNHSPQREHQVDAPKGDYSSTGVDRGEAMFGELGCVACHTDADTPVAPTLHGIYGKAIKLADGGTVTVDDDYLHESIKEPGAKLVEGYSNIMPKSYGVDLSEDQIRDLIVYVKSLK